MPNNHSNSTPPILLTIAGFDPSCGAGIAADLKTFSAHNCYGVAAVSALTVQSTQGVLSVHNTPAAILRAQLDTLAQDIIISAVKIGMLGTKANGATVAEFLDAHKFAHVVLDTPFKSSSGHELYDISGVKHLVNELMKRASVITPNVPEAEILTGMEIKDLAGMEAAARKLFDMGATAVVVKGGHMEKAIDVLFDGNEILPLYSDHVKSENTHGSGCTFASAIAAQLALGRALSEAVMLAKAYVTKAIEKSYPIGKGIGPLDHFYRGRQDPPLRSVHEVPQHGMHPAAEPATH